MATDVVASGYEVTADLGEAQVVVLNTCGFIRDAVEESVAEALELAEWRSLEEGRRLIVAGCMVSRYGNEFVESFPEADAVISLADRHSLASVISTLVGPPKTDESSRRAARQSASVPTPHAYLMISDGCDRVCSYCTIPSIRGRYRSKAFEKVLNEADAMVRSGAREIIFIGQDITSWGKDLPDDPRTLVDLVDSVSETSGLNWLRLMYCQPNGLTDELLELMARKRNICNYLDIPLQHVSEDILRSMRRSGSPDELRALIANIRTRVPDIILRTTFIAGFPGETRYHSSELMKFVEETGFDYVGVFPFSPEHGTAAYDLPDQISSRTRVARAQKIRDLADSVAFEKNAGHVGRQMSVLSVGVDEEGMNIGRWAGQAPDIDGVVILDRVVPVGQFVQAIIVDSLGYDLVGEVCSDQTF
ncbi:MAG: 30S ribosomal protein S12 methylthiotransferase RimO [Actinobacteria bacterium]|nr:30S ribosomal protein S12 methylthiotransferase RimO [Actinomycetota bacterium]MCL5887584.1 30S ribosomal protein S12 methylthiotransferase RimO [Actinomycetota bacterium]